MESVVFDLTAQAELARRRADPAPGRLAGTGVVVLDALGDGLEVVVRLALAELPDREHMTTESREPALAKKCNCVRRFHGWRGLEAEAPCLGGC